MNTMCFACGPDNPIGLKLSFWWEGEELRSRFCPKPEHQGYSGLLHGGIISTLLDEMMAKHLEERGVMAVTAIMETRFHQPVHTGTPLNLTGRLLNQKSRTYQMEARATFLSGKLAAEAKGTFVRL